ncbi:MULTISPECIES: nitrilase-related carbon-nitrogen hydrolase [Chromobacterium]|uniref:Carbon-nitrogen hydrolase n=1 Tax=Chromobacterium rhizoryzae TaxID=1778675 RepID=A0AAD0RVV7_9NEIS|nr:MULTISPECIES: nitrilase-related carbon-nitrogen hydrolase [Chromobacterium]AXT48360.1 carbon-nitrogen hydrolase [Chromobacterium rhizoryzae]
MNKIKVACCQVAPVFGDVDGNLARAERALESAAALGAQVAVLPELANTGYVFASREEAQGLAEAVDGRSVSAWAALARRLGMVVAAGFCEAGAGGGVYNSAVLLGPDGEQACYRKAHLWDAEKLIFDLGDQPPPVLDTRFGRLALMICYDLEIPEWVRLPALAGAELLCAPVNWPVLPHPPGERQAERFKAQANAAFNRLPIAVCDRHGRERGVDWSGASLIVDANGYPQALAETGLKSDQLLLAELDLAASRDKFISQRNHVLDDRRPGLYRAPQDEDRRAVSAGAIGAG